MHRELHNDQIVLSHDPMNDRRRAIEIMLKRRKGLSQALASLWACRMLDEVISDEIQG